jgi:hypothetical protein
MKPKLIVFSEEEEVLILHSSCTPDRCSDSHLNQYVEVDTENGEPRKQAS